MSKVIILNGSSSSGKSTLAAAIQQCSDTPFQHISLDQFRDGLPMSMRGLNAPENSPGAQGLNVVPELTDHGVRTHIRFGEHGKRVLEGMRRCVAIFAQMGLNVVVDDLFFEAEFLQQYRQLLDPASTWLVGVQCDPESLQQREQARLGRFPGTALAHMEQIHTHGTPYDLVIDTTSADPLDSAAAVLNRMATPPEALSSMSI